jgi:hypothetical protein
MSCGKDLGSELDPLIEFWWLSERLCFDRFRGLTGVA